MDVPGGSETPESQATRQVRRLGGRRIVFDNEGFFLHPDDWSEDAARLLAVVRSPHPHARIKGLDFSVTQTCPAWPDS